MREGVLLLVYAIHSQRTQVPSDRRRLYSNVFMYILSSEKYELLNFQ